MKFFLELIRLRVQRIFIKQPVKGFTLLEFMIVIACISILSVAVAPSVRGYLRNISLRNAVYQISGDLYTIKSQAIRTRSACSIDFDNVLHTYTLSDPARTVDLGEFEGGVAFTANPDGGAEVFSPTITFNSRGLSGLSPAATTQVYVTNQDNRIFRIQASAAGAISIQTYNSAGNNWVR